MKGEEGREILVYGMTSAFELGRSEFLSQMWVNRCQTRGVGSIGWVRRLRKGKVVTLGSGSCWCEVEI